MHLFVFLKEVAPFSQVHVRDLLFPVSDLHSYEYNPRKVYSFGFSVSFGFPCVVCPFFLWKHLLNSSWRIWPSSPGDMSAFRMISFSLNSCFSPLISIPSSIIQISIFLRILISGVFLFPTSNPSSFRTVELSTVKFMIVFPQRTPVGSICATERR